METSFIILIILLMSTILAIYKLYKSELNSKNFIICIYLYVLLSLFLVSIIGKYTSTLSIVDLQNTGKMIIIYFILAFSGLCLIFNDIAFVNHIGLLLICISIGLTIGVTYKNSKNINSALIMTSVIVCIFTIIAFCSEKGQLLEFDSWLPYLSHILFAIIIIQLLYSFFYGTNEKFQDIMSWTIVILFIGFILSDTSKIILDSKILNCHTHACINYPKKIVGLLLNYVNIFVNLNSNK